MTYPTLPDLTVDTQALVQEGKALLRAFGPENIYNAPDVIARLIRQMTLLDRVASMFQQSALGFQGYARVGGPDSGPDEIVLERSTMRLALASELFYGLVPEHAPLPEGFDAELYNRLMEWP